MMISFEIDSAGISLVDMAQFMYDNYSNYQLMSLHSAMTEDGSVTTMRRSYNSEEELSQIKQDAKDRYEEVKKIFEPKEIEE
jgi:hypothetical protein